MIADLQSERMDEQRAMLPGLVNRRGISSSNQTNNFAANTPAPDDAFLDMLMRCQVIKREKRHFVIAYNTNFFSFAEYPA